MGRIPWRDCARRRPVDSRQSLEAPTTPDAIDLLLAQHARIEELFGQVLAADGERRRESFAKLVALLTMHEAAEEAVVHPLARTQIDAGPEVVDDRIEEERVAKQLLAELDADGTDAPGFARRLMSLRDAVLRHAKSEERYEFRQLRHVTDTETRQRLADAVRAVEESGVPTSPPVR